MERQPRYVAMIELDMGNFVVHSALDVFRLYEEAAQVLAETPDLPKNVMPLFRLYRPEESA